MTCMKSKYSNNINSIRNKERLHLLLLLLKYHGHRCYNNQPIVYPFRH